LAGCSLFRGRARVPLPTFTPTSAVLLGISAPANASAKGQPDFNNQTTPQTDDLIVITKAPAPTSTPVPTVTPLPSSTMPPPTPIPTITSTPIPVLAATSTPTFIPTPSPIPEYLFDLEDSTKFPTDSLAPDIVRIYLYVYSQTEFAMSGYSLRVLHNGVPLLVEGESTGGLPIQTRVEPSPHSRFANFNVVFAESQVGEWIVALQDSNGAVVGPPAQFTLTADEETRELYVRYLHKDLGQSTE